MRKFLSIGFFTVIVLADGKEGRWWVGEDRVVWDDHGEDHVNGAVLVQEGEDRGGRRKRVLGAVLSTWVVSANAKVVLKGDTAGEVDMQKRSDAPKNSKKQNTNFPVNLKLPSHT